MKVTMLAVACLATTPALAQEALTPAEQEGRLHFQQSCAICHTKPTITSPLYGPALSKATFENGREAEVKGFITDGTPNMPGFRHHFTAAQIEMIVAYLKTVPTPPPAPAKAEAPAPRNQDR